MIVETATVETVDGDVALLRPRGRGACSACSASGGCGAWTLAKAFGLRSRALAVHNAHGLRPGDEVRVAISERGLLGSAALTYLLPLAAMLAAALAASVTLGRAAGGADTWDVLGGAFGLLIGFWLTRRLAPRSLAEGVVLVSGPTDR